MVIYLGVALAFQAMTQHFDVSDRAWTIGAVLFVLFGLGVMFRGVQGDRRSLRDQPSLNANRVAGSD
jgi:hypothetical protein